MSTKREGLGEEWSDVDELVGQQLGTRYFLTERLGAGGMGTVYRGIHTEIEREVAIKILKRELTQQKKQLLRFQKEVAIISRLHHPNVVQVLDTGHVPELDIHYLVMEMVPGKTLRELCEDRRVMPAAVLEIAYQVCAGLSEPHRAGIVHRDIKPDNILLVAMADETIQAKVVDFGIARVAEREEEGSSHLTSAGMILGTPHYMAPEIPLEYDIDARTDLYALGVMMYEMCTGKLPFEGEGSSMSIVMAHVYKTPKPFEELLGEPFAHPEIEALVMELLDKHPENRPESARAVRHRIEAIRDELQLPRVRINPDVPITRAFDRWIVEAQDHFKDTTEADPLEVPDLRALRGEPSTQKPSPAPHTDRMPLPAPHTPTLKGVGPARDTTASESPGQEDTPAEPMAAPKAQPVPTELVTQQSVASSQSRSVLPIILGILAITILVVGAALALLSESDEARDRPAPTQTTEDVDRTPVLSNLDPEEESTEPAPPDEPTPPDLPAEVIEPPVFDPPPEPAKTLTESVVKPAAKPANPPRKKRSEERAEKARKREKKALTKPSPRDLEPYDPELSEQEREEQALDFLLEGKVDTRRPTSK